MQWEFHDFTFGSEEVYTDWTVEYCLMTLCSGGGLNKYMTDGQKEVRWSTDNNWLDDGSGNTSEQDSLWNLYEDSSTGPIRSNIKTRETIMLIAGNKNEGENVWAKEQSTERKLYWDNVNDWIKVDG